MSGEDTDLLFTLSIEDNLSEGADQAHQELDDLVAEPYEGKLNITASMEDEASPVMDSIRDSADSLSDAATGASSSIDDVGASAGAANGNVNSLSEGANELAQNLDDTTQATGNTADSMDLLAQSQLDAADAADQNTEAASQGGLGLSEAANAATVAGGAAQGASVSGRLLVGIMGRLGKEAGASSESVGEFTTAMRLGTVGSRLFAAGGEGAVATLVRFGAYGIAAAAAIGVTAVAWKTNAGGIRDVAMGIRLSFEHSLNSIKKDLASFGKSLADGGNAVHKFGQEHTIAGAPIRFLEKGVGALSSAVHILTRGMTDEGAAHNRVTAQIEHESSAQNNLKSSIDNVKNARTNAVSAARAAEDAELRVSTASHTAEGAQISLERAIHDNQIAHQKLADVQQDGTATANDLWEAQMNVRESDLQVKQSKDQVAAAAKDEKRSNEDLPGAYQNVIDKVHDLNQAQIDQRSAMSDTKQAQDDLNNSAQGLQATIDLLRARGSEDYAVLADNAVEELGRIKAAQDQIDPTLRHSPSLVDRVETGVNQIISHYARLGASGREVAQPAPAQIVPNITAVAGESRIGVDIHFNDQRLKGMITATVRSVIRELGTSVNGRNRSNLSAYRLVQG